MNNNAMNNISNEDILLQTESIYDMAMNRIGKEYPEIPADNYSDRVWFAVSGAVKHQGYEAAKDYALNAPFCI